MEGEELPSESTSTPRFRKNATKQTNLTNTGNQNNSSSKNSNKNVKSTSEGIKRISSKPKKQSDSPKTKHSSKTRSKASPPTLDNCLSTDDDMREPTPVQKSRSDNSSTRRINQQVTENLTDLDNSIASDETDDEVDRQTNIIQKKTNKTKQDVLKNFIEQANGEFKCRLCRTSSKTFPKSSKLSDSNLRSHLARSHDLVDFFYPSQRPVKILPEEKHQEPISNERKTQLNTAAIQAIIEDSHSFNIFRKSGMQKFLALAVPGYRGPNRRTVAKRLKPMYKQRRSTIRNNLSSAFYISLSVDMWKSIRKDHFLCLSAHYYDDHYQVQSQVIAFRRFHGAHNSERIEKFIDHEVEKLDIQTKICSITSDNGSDIKAATQNKLKFGTRLSCLIHVFNLVVQNGLWLFKKPKAQNIISSTATNTNSSIKRISTSNSTLSKSATTKSKRSSSSNNAKPSSSSSNRSKSASSTTTKPNQTVATFTDSSTEDDSDYIIDDDQVSDGISDGSENDITKEDSDVDSSSDNISITTSSCSESSWSSSEHDTDYEALNESLQSPITEEEEEFLNRSSTDPSHLLFKVYILLKRVRKLVRMIRNTSTLHRYVVKQIKLKLEILNRELEAQHKKKLSYKEFTLDMKIRWSSSYIMISRFVFYSTIITSLTYNPPKEIKLKACQSKKLKKLSFTSVDWAILKALESVLAPFHTSTKILSIRRRPTMSICQSVILGLKNILTVADGAPLTLENLLKNQLLLNLHFYFDKHINIEQWKAILVSAFLDPTTYAFMSSDDKKEAEIIIYDEAKNLRANSNSSSLPTAASQSSITTNSNTNEENNQSKLIKEFLISCGVPLEIQSASDKPSDIKEEIAQHIIMLKRGRSFSHYWDTNQDRLPVLSSFARKYNIMCPTSIDCESSFSIAGFLHRKNRSALSPSTLRYSMILRETN